MNEVDAVYRERNRVVCMLATLALVMCEYGKIEGPNPKWGAGIGKHPDDPAWNPEWRTIVFVDTPLGQMSWHMHDSDAALFAHLPAYTGAWDGHTTEDKYERMHSICLAIMDELAEPLPDDANVKAEDRPDPVLHDLGCCCPACTGAAV